MESYIVELIIFVMHLENDETDSKAPSFEELCRAHIAAFAKGAEKYAMESKLSTCVGKWQVTLLPLLEEEERRPAFDIHWYGETVIHKMERQITSMSAPNDCTIKHNKTVAFRDISHDCQPFDVCRLFLAALSLSNSQNVKFTSDSTLNSLQLELLSSDMERPMETYFAPSVMDTTV
jgi:condensin-2 complex subunit H2